MKLLPIAVGLAVLEDTKKGDYHCHQGKLKGRTYKSQDTMLAAHPELRGGAAVADKKAEGERLKKDKAEDKLKDGDKTRTEEYAKDAKKR